MKSGIRVQLIPCVRMFAIVTMKLIVPRRDERVSTCGRGSRRPGRCLRSAATAAGRPSSPTSPSPWAKKESSRITPPKRKSQYDIAFSAEGHVPRADHQRHEEVAEAGQDRDDDEEDHRRPVHGHDLVVGVAREEVVVGLRQLRPQQDGCEPAGEEEEPEADDVDPDPLQVDGDEPARDAAAPARPGPCVNRRRIPPRVVGQRLHLAPPVLPTGGIRLRPLRTTCSTASVVAEELVPQAAGRCRPRRPARGTWRRHRVGLLTEPGGAASCASASAASQASNSSRGIA